VVTLQNSGYEQWGRPVGMDNPAAGCGGFRDGSVVSKFNLSVRVTNNRGAPIKANVLSPEMGRTPGFYVAGVQFFVM
jgi:hypothetical protein